MNEAGGRLRALPPVQHLLERPEAAGVPRALLVGALRRVLDECRRALLAGEAAKAPAAADILARALALIEREEAPVLRRVINATGIIVHTNLGRAPLAAEAIAAVADVAAGYSNLEYDLTGGRRGSRTHGIEPLLCRLTGADAALAVNNAAAALLLALSAHAAGGEVIVSRGELVEIGGGFRIPEVIAQGGARLVEVGTTNRTRAADYAGAIGPETRALLKVHASNYRMTGFTAAASLGELAPLARANGLMLIHDLGSGALAEIGSTAEPTVSASLRAGADLVAFSGDKLMGGPQAGLLVGTRAAIDPLHTHPLLRAVRLDKMALAALEATLRLHRDPARAAARVPVLRMLGETAETTRARAERLRAMLPGWRAEIVSSTGYAGGGALPEQAMASHALALDPGPGGADDLARRLRLGRPALVGRIAEGRLLLDMLTVADEELAAIADALGRLAAP